MNIKISKHMLYVVTFLNKGSLSTGKETEQNKKGSSINWKHHTNTHAHVHVETHTDPPT